MKTKIAAYVAASIFAVAMPAAAAEHSTSHVAGDAQCAKECQMLARNCGQQTDSIQTRISKLKAEIAKGTATYTGEELEKLKAKLKDAEGILATLTQGG